MIQLTLKGKTMLGVYTLYIIRKLKSPFVGEIFALGIFSALLSLMVSVPHIISNIILTHCSYSFFIDAFSKTHTVVKLLFVSAILACGLFVRNITVFTVDMVKERFV